MQHFNNSLSQIETSIARNSSHLQMELSQSQNSQFGGSNQPDISDTLSNIKVEFTGINECKYPGTQVQSTNQTIRNDNKNKIFELNIDKIRFNKREFDNNISQSDKNILRKLLFTEQDFEQNQQYLNIISNKISSRSPKNSSRLFQLEKVLIETLQSKSKSQPRQRPRKTLQPVILSQSQAQVTNIFDQTQILNNRNQMQQRKEESTETDYNSQRQSDEQISSDPRSLLLDFRELIQVEQVQQYNKIQPVQNKKRSKSAQRTLIVKVIEQVKNSFQADYFSSSQLNQEIKKEDTQQSFAVLSNQTFSEYPNRSFQSKQGNPVLCDRSVQMTNQQNSFNHTAQDSSFLTNPNMKVNQLSPKIQEPLCLSIEKNINQFEIVHQKQQERFSRLMKSPFDYDNSCSNLISTQEGINMYKSSNHTRVNSFSGTKYNLNLVNKSRISNSSKQEIQLNKEVTEKAQA
ncbi:UNKNOWN [Stylonychia lemnae]|uniref:Uncharacterized protein n=1 Tax=Stylonychia lemnae TaxID=5949 RepID=A0A078AMC1_STYLE|nr:UNKNOWN [Stylonychia lemnae]|eukprot:CDW83545.1 UNKNOWN [Stylonychia lemnae]